MAEFLSSYGGRNKYVPGNLQLKFQVVLLT